MAMFNEPLQQKQPGSVSAQLLTLYNAYCEFHDYCSFLHQAHEGIVTQAELDQSIVEGIGMSGHCLVTRSSQIKQQLNTIMQAALEREKR